MHIHFNDPQGSTTVQETNMRTQLTANCMLELLWDRALKLSGLCYESQQLFFVSILYL